uniref:Serpin domain-containing protein n=1 Tax=Oryza barthii TaxID=65489 RepID=A0A0D3HJV4_9ORYZ
MEAADEMNDWVAEGKWENPFNEEDTEEDEFHLLDGSSVTAPFMRSWKDRLIACHDGFKVLNLLYQDNDEENVDTPRFSMCVFLPNARDGVPALVDRIASDDGFLLRHLPSDSTSPSANSASPCST